MPTEITLTWDTVLTDDDMYAVVFTARDITGMVGEPGFNATIRRATADGEPVSREPLPQQATDTPPLTVPTK